MNSLNRSLKTVHSCLFVMMLCLLSSCREGYRYQLEGENRQGSLEEIIFDKEVASEDSTLDMSLTEEDFEVNETGLQWEQAGTRLIRLTSTQYLSLVNRVLGRQTPPTSPLPRDLVIDGSIALGTSRSVSTDRDVEQISVVAEEIAHEVSDNLEWVIEYHPCVSGLGVESYQSTVEKEYRDQWVACLSLITDKVAMSLWGRALNAEEWSSAYQILGRGVDLLKRPSLALSFSISWLLQSPYTLYRFESLHSSESRSEGGNEEMKLLLSQKTLADRLSYLLHNQAPDPALREADHLFDRATWSAEVDRLLSSPKFEFGVRAIFNDLWSLWRLDRLHLEKDPERFEHLSAELGPAAREETLMGVWRVAEEDLPLSTLFTQRVSYVNRALASIYRVPAPSREGFDWVEFPESSMRTGLLGQLSYLALNAHPTSTSSTLRGYFVLDRLLCVPPPPPPSGVDTSIPEPTPERPTLRDRLESHLSEPSCSGCHRPMDMIGLAFEGFDSLGGERQSERGVAIDLSGEVLGEEVYGPRELAHLISEHERLAVCLTRQIFRYARAQYETEDETRLIEQLVDSLRQDQLTIKSILRTIAMSEGFHGPYRDEENRNE